MRYFVYILYSKEHNKTYVGYSNNLERRLKEHNSGKSEYTKKYLPWKIVYTEEYESEIDARHKEKYYKSAAGRRKIKKIIDDLSPGSSAG
uniref:GIY-YIG nuclease family protein n=1 Tax=Ignavibacterium album TaxID=591197 RepID=A0A832DFW2_9BACT